jgi:hypothetical protein
MPFSPTFATWRQIAASSLFAALATAAFTAQAAEAARVVMVAGEAQVGQRALAVGDAINEGDEITTGMKGFIYMKTVDDGLLILRPSSKAKIVAYQVDKVNPANTHVKFELQSGVARAVSGSAVKMARQNFRFNTPVAAIGVRGTDFTVATDQETSRVTVISGAIVVAGFGGACAPGGTGPCEGAASRELSAAQVGQMLQVRKGQTTPQLLSTGSQSPDTVAPPRSDEPVAKSTTNGNSTGEVTLDPQKTDKLLQQVALAKPTDTAQPPQISLPPAELPVVTPEVQSAIVWGRWQPVMDQAPNVNTVQLSKDGAEEIARNSYYVVSRTKGAVFQSPAEGSVGFVLNKSEAMVMNESTSMATAATLQNGKLNVDFGKSTFATSFDLVNEGNRYALQSQGVVTKDGVMYGDNQFSKPTNMNVTGVLSNENGGSASYIFSSRLDAKRVVNGVTYWTR